MELERLAVQLRWRGPWEAIDLGFAMVRAWWRQIYAPWLTMFLPLVVVCALVLPPTWAVVLLWWLKPALDRLVLHVLAGAVFGHVPGWRTTLLALPDLRRNGLFGALTWRRFDLARAFSLPVRQLEGARGKAARARLRQLHRRTRSYAIWLGVTCLHFELVIALSLIGLYDLLLPAAAQTEFNLFSLWRGSGDRLAYVYLISYAVAMGLLEPFYVAGGFALYLNRRTALEGWDLEVQMRRLAQRAQARTRPANYAIDKAPVLTMLMLVIGLGLGALPIEPARAESPVRREIDQVLRQSEFQEYREVTRLRSVKPAQKEAPRASHGWGDFGRVLAQVLRYLVWGALAVVIVWAAWVVLRRIDWIPALSQSRHELPESLFGLDLRPESLPIDIAATAARLARAGDALQALSLLYRGALASLLRRDQLHVASGDTEADCLRKTQPRLPSAMHAYFTRLLLAWQSAAYAHRHPLPREVEQLCVAWREHFAA